MRRPQRFVLRVRSVLLSSCTILVGLLGAARGLAQTVDFELLPGSRIVDDCRDCDRIPIEREIGGKLRLLVLPSLVCCVYEVQDLSFADADGEYIVEGGGMYSTSEIGETTQQMSLELEIGGVRGIALESGRVIWERNSPVIEISVTEDGLRDPVHRYTIEIIAAPVDREPIEYSLIPGSADFERGSFLEIICPNCLLVEPRIRLDGRFRLSRLGPDVGVGSTWIIEDLAFHTLSDVWDLRVLGHGSYEVSTDRPPTQSIRLRVDIGGVDGRVEDLVLRRERSEIAVDLPQISIDADEGGVIHAGFNYRLILVAEPADGAEPSFRRGDANDDGTVDLSDAVSIFLWLFAGAGSPSCLEAADTDANGGRDITDGIYVLLWLFQGGPAPGAPGPVVCGSVPGFVDCAIYDSCAL